MRLSHSKNLIRTPAFTGAPNLEELILDGCKRLREIHFHLTASAKAFLKMTNLRLLKIHNLQLPAGLESLSDELRLLQWHGYPLKSLASSMEMDKTLEFNMCYRGIELFWKRIKVKSTSVTYFASFFQ